MDRRGGDQPFEIIVTNQSKGKGWEKDAEGHGKRAPRPAAEVADKRRKDDQGRGKDARKSDTVQKLGVRHPRTDHDRVTLQKRNHGVGAAKREQAGAKPREEQAG